MSAKLSSKNFYGGNLMVKCFVALVIFFCSVGNLFAQTETKVTINVDKVLIRTALERLQKETKVHFVYDEENIDQDKRVSLSYTQAPLKIVLEDFCKQTSLRYEVKRNLILILPGKADRNVNRQSFLMKGVVTDEDGESIIGATVMIGGTSKGTVTDINGQYTLEVQSGDLVSFTFVGMTDKVIKAQVNKKMVNVQLESNATALADVVITGYQTLSKERATGSFDKVDSSVLSSRPTADLSTALQGLVAGMQATEKEDGSIDFLIRGSSSLYADKKPLLVVDGFPIQGDFSSINPNDVESVTVLKDAAAASIWGARSANGVIVVTTKKGKKDKVQVDVQAFVRIGTNPDLEYIMNQADSRTMVDYEMRAFENNWKMAAWEYAPIFSKIQNSLTLAQELYYANKYQGLSKEEMEQGLERLRNTSNRQQLKDYLMQTQLLQQYNVSISGGTERMSNYMSLMYEKNDESTIKRGYEKFMINYNNSYKVTKWLTANLITTLQRKDQETSGVTIGEFSNLSPYEMLLNEDGSYATNLNVYNRAELEKLPLEKLPYSDWSYNMLREVRGREYKTTNTMYRVQLGLNAQIIKGLNYDMRVQYESTSSEYKNYDSEDTFYARNLVNSYTEYNNETQEVGVSRIPKGGVLRSGKTEYSNYVFRNQLNYNNSFAEKHEISALAGIEISQYDTEGTVNPYVYGYNKEKNTSSVPPYGYGSNVDSFKNFFGNSATIEGGNTSYSLRCDRYVSYYTNIGYVYDGKYGASFSARGDGSNFVSDDPSLRWSPMWSVGAKWNIGKEEFIKDIDWINYLNLRATYGINGNAEKSTSPLTLVSVGSSVNSTTGTITGNISSFGNPSLCWEKTYTTNIGVDFDLFRSKLSGKLDFYNRKSKDVIGQVTIPSVYGTSTQKFNNAEILNRGVELELTGNFHIPSVDLGIRSTVTYAYNYNKILKLYYPALYCYELVEADTHVEGRPVGSLYSYDFLGTENGIPYVIGANGDKISMNDVSVHNRSLGLDILHYSGTTIPPHTFGWSNQFTWNNFSLYVYLTGNFGGIFRAPTAGSIPSVGSGKTFVSSSIKDFADSDGTLYPTWPLKDESNFYLWDRYTPNLEYFVQDASFIRLKEINLEYNLSKKLAGKLHLRGAKLFVQARNLGLIYCANDYGYDPEWLPGSNKPSATIAFGANINF